MNRNRTNRLTVILLVIVICGSAILYGLYKHQQKVQMAIADTENSINENYITYQGKKYRYNTEVKTILFLGVDTREEIKVQGVPGYSGQSDTIILFVMNTRDKTTTMLEISRDTITDIKLYDMSGDYLSSEKAQIALQYAYGDGSKRSCQLSKNAVSNLLYNIPIQSYFSLNIDGIGAIVDELGGVRMVIPEDATMIDPAFIEGQEVVMNANQAEAYVRYRDKEVTGSNNDRMERQNYFLRALISQIKSQDTGIADVYNRLVDTAGNYMVTDINAEEMEKLSKYDVKDEILKIPGEIREGDEHDEFIVNEEELYKIILNLFYKQI